MEEGRQVQLPLARPLLQQQRTADGGVAAPRFCFSAPRAARLRGCAWIIHILMPPERRCFFCLQAARRLIA